MAHRFYRYQLNKEATTHVAHHPWVFREHMSSAAAALPDGAWLRLFDGANAIVGFGIYAAEGAIAVRVLRRGDKRPDDAYLRARVSAAIARRAPLAARTTGVRLVHGENDSLPAVTIDRFGDTLVAQSYAAGADGLARYVALLAARELAIGNVVMRPSHRRIGGAKPVGRASASPADDDRDGGDAADRGDVGGGAVGGAIGAASAKPADRGDPAGFRVVRGAPPAVATFTEDGATYSVDLAGQKSGAYLDLRGLRAYVRRAPLANARVLNLFSYTGMLAAAAVRAGAAHVTSVDQSEAALAFGRAHHGLGDAAHHATIAADAFTWIATDAQTYELAIVDPPAMTSNIKQVPKVLAAYRKLYAHVAPRVAPGGAIVAACCTSRVTRAQFDQTVSSTLGAAFTREHEIPPELDHPVGFPQADYLKIAVYRRAR